MAFAGLLIFHSTVRTSQHPPAGEDEGFRRQCSGQRVQACRGLQRPYIDANNQASIHLPWGLDQTSEYMRGHGIGNILTFVILLQTGVDGSRPFNRPIFIDMIKKIAFASTQKKRSIASKFSDRFTSSSHLKPHEMEMPEAIVALSCAVVRHLRV